MNTNRTFALLAAVLVTAGQALLFAVDTAAVAQVASLPGGYESPLKDTLSPGAFAVGADSAATIVG
jgi:hypothetical protein